MYESWAKEERTEGVSNSRHNPLTLVVAFVFFTDLTRIYRLYDRLAARPTTTSIGYNLQRAHGKRSASKETWNLRFARLSLDILNYVKNTRTNF